MSDAAVLVDTRDRRPGERAGAGHAASLPGPAGVVVVSGITGEGLAS